ncbi:uncharacterized protein G2W53_032256 [Senna tora]|uniref:Uncharacterized protein n=1 Tax=Senna tora TaxID=362788 RepID=A0A834W647_9FABA|nr:uncharacterized protein G2W53_032256 [Senna tora]
MSLFHILRLRRKVKEDEKVREWKEKKKIGEEKQQSHQHRVCSQISVPKDSLNNNSQSFGYSSFYIAFDSVFHEYETKKFIGENFPYQYSGAEASNVDNKELSILNCEGFDSKIEPSLEQDNASVGVASKKRQKLHWGYNLTLVDSPYLAVVFFYACSSKTNHVLDSLIYVLIGRHHVELEAKTHQNDVSVMLHWWMELAMHI